MYECGPQPHAQMEKCFAQASFICRCRLRSAPRVRCAVTRKIDAPARTSHIDLTLRQSHHAPVALRWDARGCQLSLASRAEPRSRAGSARLASSGAPSDGVVDDDSRCGRGASSSISPFGCARRRWPCSAGRCVKHLPQSGQENGRSPVCTTACRSSCDRQQAIRASNRPHLGTRHKGLAAPLANVRGAQLAASGHQQHARLAICNAALSCGDPANE